MHIRSFLIAMLVLVTASMSAAADTQADEPGASSPDVEAVAPQARDAARAAPLPAAPIPPDKVDAERESLARIAYELEALKVMVRDAGRDAPTMARVQFRYDWLLSDLELIERGIQDHLDAPRQPRVVVPLKGDYRR
jgi:RAQPRD family integrative conjugative element protein